MSQKVHFTSRGLKVVGDLYLPAASAPDRKRSAVVVGHPMGGVKEQTAGLHAKKLCEQGFIALAFDAAYQGESEGEPRGLEDPSQRVEDVKSAVTFLSLQSGLDPERIGALGICASGGYVPFAAQTDVRIKAVATVSAADVGSLFREGMKNTSMQIDRQTLEKTLEAAGQGRIAEAKGEPPNDIPLVPDDPKNIPAGTPTLFTEASDYYRTPRGQNSRSTNRFPIRSYDLIVNYSSYAFIDLISPRPLLMIAGSEADSRYFSEEAISQAKEPKELFIVPKQTHVGLYDHIDGHINKLVSFFIEHLTK